MILCINQKTVKEAFIIKKKKNIWEAKKTWIN
jgi:hypothetical protein